MEIIRAEIWAKLIDSTMIEESIIASSYSEVHERLDAIIAKYEDKVIDSGYEIIDIEGRS